jgi:hypothetical protein
MRVRPRQLLVLVAAGAVLASGGALAAPVPSTPPPVVKEVVSVTRTAKTGQAVVALAGKVRADRQPGFFAVVDRYPDGSELETIIDFGSLSGATRYGHGSEEPLCDAPFACEVSRDGDTLKFTLTVADDNEDGRTQWTGLTRYFVLEGTSIEITSAAVGFAVKRRAPLTFQRVSAAEADADGVGYSGMNAEVFRAASARGGDRGSFAVAQLPCDFQGAGSMTFSATGDLLPSVITCTGTSYQTQVGVADSHTRVGSGENPGLYTREASTATSWQLSGAISGVTTTSTRLFVLDY